jgi:hypothetical protein
MALGPKTFIQFLKAYQRQPGAEGNFARQALRAKTFPAVTSWPQLQHYLMTNGGGDRVTMRAAETVWTAYEESQGLKGP